MKNLYSLTKNLVRTENNGKVGIFLGTKNLGEPTSKLNWRNL